MKSRKIPVIVKLVNICSNWLYHSILCKLYIASFGFFICFNHTKMCSTLIFCHEKSIIRTFFTHVTITDPNWFLGRHSLNGGPHNTKLHCWREREPFSHPFFGHTFFQLLVWKGLRSFSFLSVPSQFFPSSFPVLSQFFPSSFLNSSFPVHP